ncbi:hypothetical protein GCM10008171_33050 [Methylopila jiangsuensis]|uniref:Uncharacterized protein n=1 Tax=Methylopila jiangsuensis TaxID=586230 RepID=A0A9W6JKG9_9HYPH|nr:hypothetical protein [Methylopila jiangsuensis]MDR6284561.1 hypothetical protein [Methylopila jiangsuensis]GLK78051.1 hypothetical protein GCM10008171_33050 [Methylopila jiangsuensis]
MDGWLKALIAVTCVAVLAYVGWFGWTQYSAHQAKIERAMRAEEDRQELFEISKAKPGEDDKVRSWCSQADYSLRHTELRSNEYLRQIINNCNILGYLR